MSKVEFDPKQYATYVLTQGTIEEKRTFLLSVKSKILMNNKKIKLDPPNASTNEICSQIT